MTCSATWAGYCCDRRDGHNGSHLNFDHGVVWGRIIPSTERTDHASE